jgi:transposase
LPEDHLARFIVEIVAMLKLQPLIRAYSGRGFKPFHPGTLLALLFYGYATGVFSSRKLERATYDSVAFCYICANTHPDHDTIATFRKRFLPELKSLFVQILLIAREMGVLRVGRVCLDGIKVKANASKHRALSWEHASRLERQLQAEVEQLLRAAEAADAVARMQHRLKTPQGRSLYAKRKPRSSRGLVSSRP